ncbi:ZRT1 [Candida metapsilosis]|uniref:ZRT1 n=1 Tax=Candida metapsilosis TaxID=273372 RepID=A0A8H7ZIW4_9ASCO|nr:ZRT1 [Candida metapsilosis]
MRFTEFTSISIVAILATRICANPATGKTLGNGFRVLGARAEEEDDHDHEHGASNTTVTGCHMHGDTQYCIDWEGKEGYIEPKQDNPQSSYTGCHLHGTEVHCKNGDEELQFVKVDEEDDHEHEDEHEHGASNTTVTGCHMHGDTQYCIDWEGKEGYIEPKQDNPQSNYTGCHLHGTEVHCKNGDEELQFVKVDEEDDHDHEHGASNTTVTGCHMHGDTQYCIDWEGKEGYIEPKQDNPQSNYTGCHLHGTEVHCKNGDEKLQFVKVDEASSTTSESSTTSGVSCHFHAGVEHCVDANGNTVRGANGDTCERVDRDYDIPLRIGLLFVILVTSAIGSFGPMVLRSVFKMSSENMIITIIKQFGTGVIISTAFVHLLTHAFLMWSNECIHLAYEATGASITMAGIFLAFVIEYIAYRFLSHRLNKLPAAKENSSEDDAAMKVATKTVSDDEETMSLHGSSNAMHDKLSVIILEAGIVFHSILIGITLVVAADSFFITLFIVIVFHQFFEGLALGSRIIELKSSVWSKMLMAAIYAIITPVGMAIGIGTLHKFNGNDPSTIIALGTLDSFSAGVLLWTGLIEMWARDWLFGNLRHAGALHTSLAMVALIAGLILMSLLGKWA